MTFSKELSDWSTTGAISYKTTTVHQYTDDLSEQSTSQGTTHESTTEHHGQGESNSRSTNRLIISTNIRDTSTLEVHVPPQHFFTSPQHKASETLTTVNTSPNNATKHNNMSNSTSSSYEYDTTVGYTQPRSNDTVFSMQYSLSHTSSIASTPLINLTFTFSTDHESMGSLNFLYLLLFLLPITILVVLIYTKIHAKRTRNPTSPQSVQIRAQQLAGVYRPACSIISNCNISIPIDSISEASAIYEDVSDVYLYDDDYLEPGIFSINSSIHTTHL